MVGATVNMAKTDKLEWTRAGDGAAVTGDSSSPFAERVILTFAPGSYGLSLEPGSRLNEQPMLEGHRFAVLDEEGETLGTGATREAAAEAACMREVKWWRAHAKAMEDRLRRVMAAVKVLSSGGES